MLILNGFVMYNGLIIDNDQTCARSSKSLGRIQNYCRVYFLPTPLQNVGVSSS